MRIYKTIEQRAAANARQMLASFSDLSVFPAEIREELRESLRYMWSQGYYTGLRRRRELDRAKKRT
jgi:hypothetical protein